MLRWPAKDPGAAKDYDLDWSVWLAGDTIVSSNWTIPPGVAVTIQSNSFTTTLTQVKIAGGIVGQTYVFTNTITTLAGRTDVRRVALLIMDQ